MLDPKRDCRLSGEKVERVGNRNHGKTASVRATREWLESEGAFIALGFPLYLRPLPASAMEGVSGTKAEGELMERAVMRRLRRIR